MSGIGALISNDDKTITLVIKETGTMIHIYNGDLEDGKWPTSDPVALVPLTAPAMTSVATIQVSTRIEDNISPIKGRPLTLTGMFDLDKVGTPDDSSTLRSAHTMMGSGSELAEWLVEGPIAAMWRGESLSEWIEPDELGIFDTVPAKADEEEAEEDVDGFRLPNGALVVPRTFKVINGVAVTDQDWLERVLDIEGMYPIFLGPGGTGKTTLVEATAHRMGARLFTQQGTKESSTLSLYGMYAPHPKDPTAFIWCDSVLVESLLFAQQNPTVPVIWYYDELMQIPLEVQTGLHSLLDHRRTLFLEQGERGGSLQAPDNWHAVFASNPNEPGSEIGGPLATRMIPVEYLTNWDTVRKVVGGSKYNMLLTVAENMELQRRAGEVAWAPQIRHIITTVKHMKFMGTEYGLQMLVNACDYETGWVGSEDVDILVDTINRVYASESIQVDGRLSMR